MKYNFIFVLSTVVLFLSSCGKKEIKENGLIENHIKGAATSFTDTLWIVSEKFGEVVKDEIDEVTKYNVDDNFNITDYTVYDSDGKIKYKVVKKYGTTLDEVIQYNEDGKELLHWEYYLENDKIQKIVTTFTMDSDVVSTEIYYYYSQNNPDRLDSITEIEDSEKLKRTFEYLDDNDSYHESINFRDGTKSDVWHYFDKDGRIINEKYSKGTTTETTTYLYNDEGLLMKETKADGTIKEYVYEFDEKGSLIKRTTYVTNGIKKATEIKTRHIEYK